MHDASTLRYNVRWMEHTFTSRAITESLLFPERESGNITSNDYEAAANFLPGFHRHYRLVGGIIGIPLMYAFRKPSWTSARSYFFLTTVTLTGFVIGHAASLSAHFNFVRSIENPVGFSQAMENIQKNLGALVSHGPVIIRQKGKWEVGRDPESSSSPSDAPPETKETAIPATDAPNKPTSKWDQIRAINTRTSGGSSWDMLRQNHERARVASSKATGDDFIEHNRDESDNRAAEQARFDALLEKERKIK